MLDQWLNQGKEEGRRNFLSIENRPTTVQQIKTAFLNRSHGQDQ
jgi:hypothetical protein